MVDEEGPDRGAEAYPTEFAQHLVGAFFAAVLTVGGVAFVVISSGYGLSADTNPIGPGAVPAVLGSLLGIGGLTILVGETRIVLRMKRVTASGEAEGGDVRRATIAYIRTRLLRPFGVLVFLGAGLLLSPILGVVPSLTLAVLGIALVIERMRLWRALILAAVTALVLWLVFGLLLSVNFPESLIGV